MSQSTTKRKYCIKQRRKVILRTIDLNEDVACDTARVCTRAPHAQSFYPNEVYFLSLLNRTDSKKTHLIYVYIYDKSVIFKLVYLRKYKEFVLVA